uniref:FA complementation group E n=1 Tax=Buteo japonicus TaxID=224669 RepID=A0A8B9Z834_9AVES
MEPPCLPWLRSFDKPCRLLLHTLASSSSGVLAALQMLQRVQAHEGPGQAFPWQAFTTALCAEEPTLEGPEGALAVKPRLLLLPVVCQRNLFSLLLVVQAVVPGGCLSQLLQALEQDSHVDPWVRTLGDLIRQGSGGEECSPPPTPLSSACQQQLRCLCQKIAQNKPEGRRKLNWCFSKQPSTAGDVADSVLQGGKHREVSEESLEEKPWSCILWIAVFGVLLKDRVSLQHSELSVPPELHVLNNCSPGQLEGLCSFLQLSTCPEHLLVRFCSWLLALTPDLSYTSAAILAEQLFLQRVLSLAQPPSRHLMAALASFCSKYSQPFCRVLVAAVLQEPGEGAEQTKLVCELVEECLEPDCVQLVLSQVLEAPLSEKLLPVLQAVLERQVREVLPPKLFDLLVMTLCRQAPAFATSLNYAKLVTAVNVGTQVLEESLKVGCSDLGPEPAAISPQRGKVACFACMCP